MFWHHDLGNELGNVKRVRTENKFFLIRALELQQIERF